MKLYFVTVPTLVNFYQSQNALAAAGARTKAQLATQTTLTRENIASKERSAKQQQAVNQKLAQYKEQMANLRSARDLSSQERQAQAEMLRKDMQAGLGRESAENISKIGQAGANDRTLMNIQAQAPTREATLAKTQQDTQQSAQEQPARQAKMSAEATIEQEKLRISQSPDLQAMMENLIQARENKKGLVKTLGKDGYNSMLEGFKREGMQQGVDLDNNTDYLEATKEARADAASQVQESLKGYAEKQVKSGQLTQYAQASDAAREIQTSNAYTQAEKDSVRKKMQELAKKWNIPSELQ